MSQLFLSKLRPIHVSLISKTANRALSISLQHQCNNHKLVNLQNNKRYSLTAYSTQRNLHLTPLRQDKKKDDKDEKKNKKSKEDQQAEEYLEWWNNISPISQLGLVILGASIGLLAFEKLNPGTDSNANLQSITSKEFANMLQSEQVLELAHSSKLSKLIVTDKHGNKSSLNNVPADVSNHVMMLYDKLNIPVENRLFISNNIDESSSGGQGIVAKYNESFVNVASGMSMWILIWLYFSVYRKKPGLMNQSFANFGLPNQMSNQAQNAGKGGKKGKKDQNKQNQGGLFGGGFPGIPQQPKDEVGELIEPQDIDVGFRDVAGCEEAKVEIIEIVDFLKNRNKYERIGATVPKGALFHGPPGTGKTLFAKACAKEAGVNFIQCSGSDFIEMYVGLGSKRIRNLFKMARENSPCILFIDEIDSIGGKRDGMGSGGGSSEHKQSINTMLAEMDGFNTGKVSVVVLGATNRLESLDPALLRPGRFDRKIVIGQPDVAGRKKIFDVHLKKYNCEEDKLELAKWLATKTPGMAGAEIKNICNEAALHSIRHGQDSIKRENFEKAVDRVIAGLEKTNSLLDPKVKRRIAIHEAGHAISSWFLEECMPLVKVTITPRTEGALGFAMYQPDSNKVLRTKRYYLHQMICSLAGRAAEDLFYDEVSDGAHDDLKKTTAMANSVICTIGLGKDLPNINIRDAETAVNQQRYTYSEKTKEKIDEEMLKLIAECYNEAKALLETKKDLIVKMADRLEQQETLTRDDVIEILGERPFEDNMTYEGQTKHSKNEDFKLPPGLKHWEKAFRYKTGANEVPTYSSSPGAEYYDLPKGWVEKYTPETGKYYFNADEEKTSMRHPGKPLPPFWTIEVDEEGRTQFVHQASGYKSWSLEDDPELSLQLKDELKQYEHKMNEEKEAKEKESSNVDENDKKEK